MERDPDTSAKPGRANAFLLQEFARYYLAKKPLQAQGQELETKAELLQSGELGPLLGRWKTQGRPKLPPQGRVFPPSPSRVLPLVALREQTQKIVKGTQWESSHPCCLLGIGFLLYKMGGQ